MEKWPDYGVDQISCGGMSVTKKTLVKKKKLVSKVVSGYCEILENVFTIRLYSGKGWGVLNDFYDF